MSDLSNQNDIPDLNPVLERLQKAGMSSDEAFSFRSCCMEYSRALVLIMQYDEEDASAQAVEEEGGERYSLEVKMANLVIEELKLYLAEQGENVDHFGVPCNGGIEKIVGNIYQTGGGQEFYPCIEDKAAHLFYFLIKDHLFIDGNKRIASFLLLWFMDMNNVLIIGKEERTITYTTIYALAISVAESKPQDKEMSIRFIRNLIIAYRKSLPDDTYKNLALGV